MQWNTTIALTFHFEAGGGNCDHVAREIASDIQQVVQQAVPRATGLDVQVEFIRPAHGAAFDHLIQQAIDAAQPNTSGSPIYYPFVYEEYPDSAHQLIEGLDHQMQGEIRAV